MTAIYNPAIAGIPIPKSGNFQITAANMGRSIEFTGSGTDATLTFGTLSEGFNCYVECMDNPVNVDALGNFLYYGAFLYINATCDGITPSSVGGVTNSFPMVPHELRWFYYTGGALYSRVVRPGGFEYSGFSFQFRMPSGYAFITHGYLWAGGGTGAKSGITGSGSGASGGGGGACFPIGGLRTPTSGKIITLIIASAAIGPSTAIDGSAGSNSSLTWTGGPTIIAYGGGGGVKAGVNLYAGAPSGGGCLSAGVNGSQNTLSVLGGLPGVNSTASAGAGLGGAYGIAGSQSASNNSLRPMAAWGGAAGGSSPIGSVGVGQNSTHGGPGGGAVSDGGTTTAAGVCSFMGLSGGAGGDSTSGGDSSAYGGGSGATRTGIKAGNGGPGAISLIFG
jgi:hypothetical protein